MTERHEEHTQTHSSSSGFLSSKTKDTRDNFLINQVKGSTISGDQVTVTSGSDLTVQGSNIVGTNDVALAAVGDVNILSAKETGATDHYSHTTTSGVFSGGGLGFTIGNKSEKTTTNEQTLGEIGSSIGSLNGNLSVKSGNNFHSAGTTFVSGKDFNLTGKEITIENTINTYDSQTKYELKQSGLTFSLGNGAITSAMSAAGNIKRAGEVEDKRLKALYDYKAAQDIGKLADSKKTNLKEKLTVNISMGSSQTTTTQTTHTETVNTSSIKAGGNVNIKATEGDVNIDGTTIDGVDITLDAKNNINIVAAESKQQTDSTSNSSSASVGANIGKGFTANASNGSGKENENAVTHTASVIDASGTLKLKSGNDTNITGSQVKGDKVVADIGGNLNIASLQDTDNYTAKNQSSSAGISTGPTGGVTGSASKGKTDSNYASVIEQAGIFAGKGGFDIEVGGNTDLKGAVIASEADADKNKLSTDTLTYSDIQNKADYSSSSIGANYDSKEYKKGDENYKNQGFTPVIGVTSSGNADSTTQSAISSGTINIRSNPKQDISSLSRDTTNSVNALGKIFDKKTVQEQQELAKVFGEEAFKAVGDLGLKEDDPKKVALKAVVGGIMSQMAGGSFSSGAASAGFTQIVTNELAKLKDPALIQWASLVVGAATSKLVGGNALTGGSIAVNDIRNNWLSHDEQVIFANRLKKALKDGDLASAQSIVQEYFGISNTNAKDFSFGSEAIESLDDDGAGLLEQLERYTSLTGQTLTNTGLNYNLANFNSSGLGYLQTPQTDNLDTTHTADVVGQINQPVTVGSVLDNGGWFEKTTGILYDKNGNERTDLPSWGEYLYQKDSIVEGYYPDGTAARNIDGAWYPISSAPKKSDSTASDTVATTGQNNQSDTQSSAKNILDGTAGLGRGILGLQGDDYYDRTGTYKYWYSVGNRAALYTSQIYGIEGGASPSIFYPKYAVGYNGTLAQVTAVDAWKVGSAGSTIMNASTNNSNSGNSGTNTTGMSNDARKTPGVVTGGERLSNVDQMMRGSNGNAGVIPKEIADNLKGRKFNTFDDFREAFWREVANSKYSSEFGAANIQRMREGLAPIAQNSQQYGGNRSYVLHHMDPIHNSGGVYNLDNIRIVTPRLHQEILDKGFHFNFK